jgi:hypothetical protein
MMNEERGLGFSGQKTNTPRKRRVTAPAQKSMFSWQQKNVGQPFVLGASPWWRERTNAELTNEAYTDHIER